MGLHHLHRCFGQGRVDKACQPTKATTKVGHAHWGLLCYPIRECLPLGQALGILLDEQAIEQPDGMAVKGRYAPIHLQGVAAMGLPLLIHQMPELLQGG